MLRGASLEVRASELVVRSARTGGERTLIQVIVGLLARDGAARVIKRSLGG